jgi:hypothetical protein
MCRISTSVLPLLLLLLLLAAMSAASAAQSSGGRAPQTHQMLQRSNRPPGLVVNHEQHGEQLDGWETPSSDDVHQRRKLSAVGGAAKAGAAADGAAARPAAKQTGTSAGAGAEAGAGADAAGPAEPANAEAEVRKQLLDDYDKMSFPWAEYGTANVSMSLVFYRVLDVNLYAGESARPPVTA